MARPLFPCGNRPGWDGDAVIRPVDCGALRKDNESPAWTVFPSRRVRMRAGWGQFFWQEDGVHVVDDAVFTNDIGFGDGGLILHDFAIGCFDGEFAALQGGHLVRLHIGGEDFAAAQMVFQDGGEFVLVPRVRKRASRLLLGGKSELAQILLLDRA